MRRLLRKRQRQRQWTVAVGSIASPENSAGRRRTAPLLTSVNVVVQFSSAARCAIEPTKLRPGIEAASCCTVNDIPATVNDPDRAPPEFADAWNVKVARARARRSTGKCNP